MTTKPAAHGAILSVQLMRGLAAVAVAAFHTSVILGQPRYGGIDPLGWLTGVGWTGVNFFFVLSGFIIMFAHHQDIGRPARLGNFAFRRFARIYPIYWFFLAAFVVAALLGLGPRNFSLDPRNLLTAVTLLRWNDYPTLPLKVAWTLIFEMVFYLMFALLIVHRRVGQIAFALWLVVILHGAFVPGGNDLTFQSIWSVNFFFGIAAYLLYRRLDPRWGDLMLLLGVLLFAGLVWRGLVYDSPDLQQAAPGLLLLLGLPFTMILLGGALLERVRRLAIPRPLLILGEASFAIYLVHSAVISALAGINHKLLPGLLPAGTLWLILFIASIGVGTLAHLLVERPLLRLVRTMQPGSRQTLPREMRA